VKSPGLAAVLSFFLPGLGQIYNGQIAKGIFFLALASLFMWLMGIVIGFVLYPVLWIYAIYDAYRTAERINAARGTTSTF
jgi:TM2 domain-containing membrane protein YozV